MTDNLKFEPLSFDDYCVRCDALADRILERREQLIAAMLRYESFQVIEDEFERSVSCLRNMQSERPTREIRVHSISTFFPLNLPLYSTVLFAVAPSFYADQLFVRPPLLMRETFIAIFTILDLPSLFPSITPINLERGEYVAQYARRSEVIIFTGTYINALKLREKLPRATTFIYNGAGVNPLVITQSANIEESVHKAVAVKTFNSGQDCAGPDCILIHRLVYNDFLHGLLTSLSRVKTGGFVDREVRVGPLIDTDHLHFVGKILNQYRQAICYGGQLDYSRGIVHPTVIAKPLREHSNYTEFFAPIFYLSVYDDSHELSAYFDDSRYLEYAMYVSVFGSISDVPHIKKSILLENKIILDVEQGNKEFGGYGARASFVADGHEIHYQPILISREIQQYAYRRP